MCFMLEHGATAMSKAETEPVLMEDANTEMIREITIQFWIVIQKMKKNKSEWTIWGLISILLLSINLKLRNFHNLVPF